MLILIALVALVSSVWLTHATIAVARNHGLGVDEGVGVQKVHSHWVPRLGGVPIFVALTSSLLILAWFDPGRGEYQLGARRVSRLSGDA